MSHEEKYDFREADRVMAELKAKIAELEVE